MEDSIRNRNNEFQINVKIGNETMTKTVTNDTRLDQLYDTKENSGKLVFYKN